MNMYSALAAAPAIDRDNWDLAVAAYRSAHAAYRDHYYNILLPVDEEITRLRGPRPTRTITIVARSGQSATFDVISGQLPTIVAEMPKYRSEVHSIQSNWAAWADRDECAHKELGWDAIEEMSDQLIIEFGEARREALAVEAPDLSAFFEKLEIAFDEDADFNADDRSTLLSDVRRLNS